MFVGKQHSDIRISPDTGFDTNLNQEMELICSKLFRRDDQIIWNKIEWQTIF